jgi:MFS family permease
MAEGPLLARAQERPERRLIRGGAAFPVILTGETVSLFGTVLSGFAVSIHAFQQTRTVTAYALISLAAILPGLLVSPFAGQVVDRLERGTVMRLGNLTSAVSTGLVAALGLSGQLELWHIAVLSAVNSLVAAFHGLAFEAATTLLVPPAQLARASGAQQSGQALAQLVAPVAAGALLTSIGLSGVLIVDALTFAFALAAVALTEVPETGEAPQREATSWRFGLGYVGERPGLWGTLVVQAAINFALGMATVLLLPLVLSLSTAAAYGGVMSAAGVGMLAGAGLVAAWGGPRRRVQAVWAGGLLMAVALGAGGAVRSALGVGACAFAVGFASPLVNSAVQAIWQVKVPATLQGRVFAARRLVLGATLPLAFALAGPLSDAVFEPAMRREGWLAGWLGPLFGVGEGRGVAVIMALMGLVTLGFTAWAWMNPFVRDVEATLTDEPPAQA